MDCIMSVSEELYCTKFCKVVYIVQAILELVRRTLYVNVLSGPMPVMVIQTSQTAAVIVGSLYSAVIQQGLCLILMLSSSKFEHDLYIQA